MPIRKPIVTEIAAKTYLINEFGLNVMYLLVGQRRALVIDTGSGYCDLKALVESLTDKPYDVALTHGHVDHAGGADVFDRVWLHPADEAMARAITLESRVGYGKMLKGVLGDPDVWAYDETTVRPWARFPEVLPLGEGHAFDLGGRVVSTVETPGHTPGSVSFLDSGSRILFSGDAANPNLLLGFRGAPISTALRGLLKLKARQPEFDRNYNGHVGYAGYVDCLSQPDSMLDDCIAALRGILDGSLPVEESENLLSPGVKTTAVHCGITKVTFSKDFLWEDGEAHILP